MSCTVPQLIRNTTTRLLTENHKTVSVINNHVYVGISPDSKIKTLEQAREFAKRLMNKVHKYFEAEKFGNILSFANDKPIPNTVGMYINIPQKLIDGYEKKYGKQGNIFNSNISPKETQIIEIQNVIKSELPVEIANAVTVLQDVPLDVLGRTDLYLSLKDILNDNGINDELLINWLGINNNTLKVHPNSIKSEQQITNLVQEVYNKKKQVNNHPALQHNELAKESFEKWVKALERFPIAFQDLMLSHAVKQLNPERRNKYVLQLSDVALTNTYGQVQNQPHKLNQVGKIYDKEVLATVSDAVGHEPSASGKGYWIHIPRTENNRTKEDIEKDIKFSEAIIKIYSKTPYKVTGDRIGDNPYNLEDIENIALADFKTKKEAESYKKSILEQDNRETYLNIYVEDGVEEVKKAKDKIINLKKELEESTRNLNSAQYKVNVELLRKLSPSTWCTASSMANYYVENYDNYLLIVDGVTVAGIEALPEKNNQSEVDRINSRIEDMRRARPKGYLTSIGSYRQELEKLIKRQVKEVTSRGNNGIASIDHIDDIVAFFEKHNLDTNNDSLQRALEAKKKGKTDNDVFKNNIDYDLQEFGYELEAERQREADLERVAELYQNEQDAQIFEHQESVRRLNTVEETLQNPHFYYYFQDLNQNLRNNEQVATKAIEGDAHNIAYIDSTLPFFNELATKAVTNSPRVFEYLPQNIKEQREDLRALYNEYLVNRHDDVNDDLPFSKTNDSRIQGYYDTKNDKVVVVAKNTPVNEASKVVIHEVAHRGMLRMAKELGGFKELNQILLNAEKQLMEKAPELLKRTGHKTIEALVKDYGFVTNTEEGKFKLLQELAARWAEILVNKPKPSWWREFIDSIKNWIKQFTGKELNEQEVNELVGGFVKYGTQENKNTQDPNLRSKYFTESNTTNSVDILNKIANSDHPLNKLAQHLIKYARENNVLIELIPKSKFGKEDNLNIDNGVAYYNTKENKIYIAEFAKFGKGGVQYTILHEILHSLSHNILNNTEIANDFNKLFEYAKDNLNHEYALTNIDEFLVGLFTNRGFIERLQKLKPLDNVKKYENLFEEILDYILGLIGITKESNLYTQAFSIATNILEDERFLNERLNQVPEFQEELGDTFELKQDEEPFLLANEEGQDEGFDPDLFRAYQEAESIQDSEEIRDRTVNEDKLIDSQIEKLRNIKNELRQINQNDKIAKQALNKRAFVIQNSINRLTTNRGYTTLLNTQNKIVANAIEVLDNESKEDFKYIQNVIDDSQNLVKLIFEVHSELTDKQKGILGDLQVNLGKLQVKYNQVSTKVTNEYANSVGITYQDTNIAKRDIGTLGKFFLSAAEAKDIPELQVISKWIQYTKNKINEGVSNLKEKIFNIKQDNSNWKEQLSSFFDSKGKFIVQSTSDYYEEEKRINQEKDQIVRNPESTKQEKAMAYRKVRDWYINNSIYLRSEIGDAIWEQELSSFIAINEDLKIEDPAAYDHELYIFTQENSPQAYLDYIQKVKIDPEYYQAGITNRVGYRKLLVVPNATYNNPEYNKIKDNPIYNLIKDTIIQAQSLIPRKMTFDTGNFDKVLNEFTINLSEQDPFTIKGLLGGLSKSFTEWFTPAREGSNLSFNAIDSKGNDISFVLAPKIKEFQESKPEDLFDVLTKFYEMALTYDNHSKILPTLQLMSDKLNQRSRIKTNSFGSPIYSPKVDDRQYITNEKGDQVINPRFGKIMRDESGNIIRNEKPDEIKEGLNNARDLALFTIKSQIFGETKADEDSKFAFWGDKLINYTRLLGIGGKPFSAIVNYMVGKLNNYSWAAKAVDFDDSSLLEAQKIHYGNIMRAFSIDRSIGKEAKKLAILLDKYNILGENINKFEGDLQNKITDIMYFLMTSGEYMIHSEGLIAKMLYTKLTKLDGTEGNLWDYIQIGEKNEILYNTKEYGEQNYGEISPNSNLSNWLYQYNEYRKATQGDYANPLFINQWVWGRALMIFRRWLPQATYQRFGRESEDKTFKGRFLSVGDIYSFYKKNESNKVIPIIKTIARLVGESTYYNAIKRKITGKDFVDDFKELGLKDIDIQNMAVNIRELRISAWLFLIVLAIGYAGDDDPELVPVLNTANRVFQDLTFFMNPNSAASVIRNPLPMITTLGKLNDVKKYTLNYISGGEDTYQSNSPYAGYSKLGLSIIKATPGAAAITSTVNTITTEFSPESYRFSN